MNNNHKIKQLIKFLKDNNIGLSSTEITIAYSEFLSQNNSNGIKDFLTNKFGKEWKYLDHKLKDKITKYLANMI